MPIKVPDNLPAKVTLENEGVLLITEQVAVRQDVRPLEIALLNLMPEKMKTETQISRLLGATPLQIELTLVTTSTYAPKNTSAEHMLAFYRPWDEVRERKFDGLIITGAPIETLPFQEVAYWPELTQILEWSQSHVQETFDICWAGQAALQHFYGVPKYELPEKMFGVFPYKVLGGSDGLLRGFNDEISVPVSRHTEVRREDFHKPRQHHKIHLVLVQNLQRAFLGALAVVPRNVHKGQLVSLGQGLQIGAIANDHHRFSLL